MPQQPTVDRRHESEIGNVLWVKWIDGWMAFSLSFPCQSQHNSQLQVALRMCMWKRADSAFLRVHYAAL